MANREREDALREILERAEEGRPLSEVQVAQLLSIQDREGLEALFAAAGRVRAAHTGKKVFLYGFLYLSTHCRNDCLFCYFRRSNGEPLRYRKSHDEVVSAAKSLAESGAHLIDLTMGEDPAYQGAHGLRKLSTLVTAVREATGLPVMVSPGVLEEAELALLKEAGASWYACYQETHHEPRFREIRPGQDFRHRIEAKRAARRLGLLTEDGMLSGLGESPGEAARTLLAMGELETDQVRAMSFVPQKGTPLEGFSPGDPLAELRIIAVLRLLYPHRLIPASLDVGGLDGLRQRLGAGANVITSLVPPGAGLAGVAQSSLDIAEARRTVASVEPVLEACGLASARAEEYREWVEARMRRLPRAGS